MKHISIKRSHISSVQLLYVAMYDFHIGQSMSNWIETYIFTRYFSTVSKQLCLTHVFSDYNIRDIGINGSIKKLDKMFKSLKISIRYL